MSDEYRSGLRLRFPALGGHGYVMAVPAIKAENVGGMFEVAPAPAIWRCSACHLLIPTYMLTEGFYPRPCMGRVRALEAGA